MVRMIADNMPLFRHPAHQGRLRFQIVPHHKKRRRDLMRLQHIQNFFRLAAFIARIKGQINDRLFRISQILCMILGERLAVGIAHRRLPLLLKAQPPGTGGDGQPCKQQRQADHKQDDHGPAELQPDMFLPKRHAIHLPHILWDKPPV